MSRKGGDGRGSRGSGVEDITSGLSSSSLGSRTTHTSTHPDARHTTHTPASASTSTHKATSSTRRSVPPPPVPAPAASTAAKPSSTEPGVVPVGGGGGGAAAPADDVKGGGVTTKGDMKKGGGDTKGKGKGKGDKDKRDLLVKIGMVGDAGVGKTSLMVRYVESKFDEDYVETLGVNFLEKQISLPSAEVIFSVWDLGGAREFLSMLPMVCMDAVVMLFCFDLSSKSSLASVREWFRQVRGLNKTALPVLVGTKYDVFYNLEDEEKATITKQARKYARAMKAPLVFCSASYGINIQKLFKVVFCKVFDVPCTVTIKDKVGDPIIEY